MIFLHLLTSLKRLNYRNWHTVITLFIYLLEGQKTLQADAISPPFYSLKSIADDFSYRDNNDDSLLQVLEIFEHRLSHITLSDEAANDIDIFAKVFSKGDFDLAFNTPRKIASFQDSSSRYFYFHAIPSKTDYSVLTGPMINLNEKAFLEGPFDLSLGFHRKESLLNRSNNVYDLYGKGFLYTGVYTKQHMLRFFDGLSKFLSQSNLSQLSPQPGGNDASSLTTHLREHLSHFMPFFEQFVSFKPYYESENGTKRLVLRFKLKLEKLKKHYKHLANYFENLSNRADIKLIQTASIKPFDQLYELTINFKTLSLQYKIILDNQKIVSHISHSPITSSKAFTVYDLSQHPIAFNTTIDIDFLGFKLENIKLESLLSDKLIQKRNYSSFKLINIQTPKFSGAAFGIFSVGVIDTFIPGSLAQYFETFTKTLLMADGGNGSQIDMLSEPLKLTKSRYTNQIDWRLNASFLDNFFLTRGLAIINHLFIPSEQALEDMRRVAIKGLQHLQKDVKALMLNKP